MKVSLDDSKVILVDENNQAKTDLPHGLLCPVPKNCGVED